ncbi:hypothetical protein WJX81_002845 [Elliptochloris bilobata]|uniref:DNA-directed RNA polymerase III subunit RPC3 n=1 Tax=Elliptochloris bilobata TaxID=381761 RepID=A0AAW1RKS4_9CHLO
MAELHRPEASRLARMLVKEHFGEAVEAAFAALLLRGQQRLPELEKSSGLSTDLLKKTVLVLMQHSLAIAYKVVPEAGPLHYIYRASVAEALHFMRKPFILRCVEEDNADKDELNSSVCQQITQALLENGRLRYDQLLLYVAKQQEAEERELAETVQACFLKLLHLQQLERAFPCDLPPPVDPKRVAAMRAKKPPKQGTLEEQRMLADMAVEAAYAAYSSERFQAPDFAAPPFHPKPGDKRGRGDEAAEPVLFRLNYEEFTRRARYEQCVEIVETMHGKESGQLVSALLRAGAGQAAEAAEGESPALTAHEVVAATRGKHDYPAWDKHAVLSALRQLEAEDTGVLVNHEEAGRAYVKFALATGRVLEMAQDRMIDKVVHDRHGLIGLRVFRLLRDKKQLEQKQVAEQAVLPPKEANVVLYTLLKGGFVSIQDIPKLPDHAASRTFFTWSVNRAAVVSKMIGEYLKAAGNIRARLDFAFNQHSQVLKLLMGPNAEAASRQLTAAQRAGVAEFRRTKLVLEGRFLALDPMFALYFD